ncbi:MAG: acyl-CoA dehydrogenase [Chloroflexi bacterium RBG_13_66_10]|nr:MAG: acyl-CoA dehydrogenase [Chloroflexi bacterium RBG_13_66_10]
MYSFEPSEEQRMLIDAAQRYATNDLRPAAHEADEAGVLPPALIEKGWELGVLQASIPESFGGFGEHSAVTGVLAAEELAYGDLAGALAAMVPATYAIPILLAGTDEQRKALLPPVIEAGWKPYVAAFVEPHYDFDPASMRTTAKREGEGYLLAGEKVFVPFADSAKSFLIYASLDGKTQGFIVPAGAAGLTVGERESLLGLRGLPTFPLKLDGVKVPAGGRLGGEGGHDPAPLLAATDVAVAALALGMSRAAYDYALAYAKDRQAFGVPIAQKQAIAFGLAEMATEIEAIRLLVWEAAWKIDKGKEDAAQAAYLALTGAGDMAMMVTDRAVQFLGGHGYIREHPVELWMRNGRGIPAFAGLAMV